MTDSNVPVSECCKRRPDVYYDCYDHVVIVEVDENQHRGYLDSCECKRLNEIVSSLAATAINPVTFIRYNPDQIRHNSEIVSISKAEREALLLKTVKEELNSCADKYEIKLIQLFYDQTDLKSDGVQPYQPYKSEIITQTVAV